MVKTVSSSLLLLLFLTFTAYSQTPVQKHGRVYVKGTKMYDESGKQVQLKGIASHGIQWFDDCYTKASLKALRDDWKTDLFRITLYVEEGGYNSDTAKYINRVDELIGWCEELGLYAMIDWHVLSPGDPFSPSYSKAKAFFTYMAKKHGNKPNILFELCNEPNPEIEKGGPSWARIKNYAEGIISEIRKYSKNIAVVGTPQWCQTPGEVVGNEIKAENVMYSFHFYAASHSNMKHNLLDASEKIPVFVTEWGIGSAQELENVVDTVEAYDWLNIFKKNKISWSYWSYSDKGTTASLLDSNACGVAKWNKTNVTGRFMKRFLVNDYNMEVSKVFNTVKSETDKDGKQIMLSFSSKLKPFTTKIKSQFAVTVNGKPMAISSIDLNKDSTSLNINLSASVKLGDEIRLSYSKGSIVSTDNYKLIEFNNSPILNTVPLPGLFRVVENFDDNTLSPDWHNTDGKHFIYTEANKELKISANYTEKGWIPFILHVPEMSLLHTPVITLKIKSDVDVMFRIDVADVEDHRTNMNDLTYFVKASDTFKTMTFDFTGKFFQMYPNFQKVDASKIKIIYFYPNPGKSFQGNIVIDDLVIGKQ